VLDRGSKKSERLLDYLMKQAPSSSAGDDGVDDALRKALEHRDKLLEYDKTRYHMTVTVRVMVSQLVETDWFIGC